MRQEIVDEFTNLPISRQRKYYLRKKRDQKCTKCGRPADRGSLCVEHLVQQREYRRKTMGLKRRYFGSTSYQCEATGHSQGHCGECVKLELSVPPDHPLRNVKRNVDKVLSRLEPQLEGVAGEPKSGIPAKQLLKAWVLMTLYNVPTKQAFCEQVSYNLLWLWFLDRRLDEERLDPEVFVQEYDRVLATEPARRFFAEMFSFRAKSASAMPGEVLLKQCA